MTVPAAKRLRRDLRSRLLRGAAGLLSHLPLRVALALGTAVAGLAWWAARGTRRLMLEQLAIAFPDRPPGEREAIARASLRHLGWLAAEVVTLRRHRHRLAGYVSFAEGGEQFLREVMARGRGLVFVTGHVGNWELLAQRVAGAGVPNAVIAKQGGDERLNELMAALRAEGGVTTLWREDPSTGRAIIRTFKEGRALGILIDQDTRVQGVFVPFFGRLAHTPRAAGDLALRFRAPVVVAWSRRRKAGGGGAGHGPGTDGPGAGHEILLEEVPCDPAPADREGEARRITAACTAILERAIRERPEEWVWMHQRWKRRPPDEATASSVPKNRELSTG